jgi:AcrR family transcriptional regulator
MIQLKEERGGYQMPKIVNHVDRRHQIIEKALVVFARQGFHSTNYNEIAQACGLSRTGLYQYFPNKEAVFKETVEYVVDTIVVRIFSIVQRKTFSTSQKLQKILMIFIGVMEHKEDSAVLLEFLICLKRRNLQLTEYLEDSIKSLVGAIRELFEDLENKASYLSSTAMMLFTFLQSQILQPLFGDTATIEDSIATLGRLVGIPKEDLRSRAGITSDMN